MLKHAEVVATMPAVDLERAKTFYSDVLGLEVVQADGEELTLQAGNNSKVFIYQREATKAEHTAATFYVDDLERAVDELTNRGVVFEQYDFGEMKTDARGIIRSPRGKAAWLKDTEGNILALFAM
jgi:catechol-2,3-dioxygenase